MKPMQTFTPMKSTRLLVCLAAGAVAVVAAGVALADGNGPGVAAGRAALEARAEHVRKTRSLAPMEGEAKTVHDPFGSEDCASCHASGDPTNPGPIVDATNDMCMKCHDDPGVNTDTKKAFAHAHGGAGARCVDCHNPHNSAQEFLLHEPLGKLCISCHSDKAAASPAQHAHEAIAKPESCTKCHEQHGSERPHLLAAAFPSTFYAPYSADAYALCFSCHDKKLVEETRTTTATKFRDGDKNLHSIHVMRADKGRTCAACHDLHVGSRANLVKDDVPFGTHGWRLPINFAPTESGGSCAKTCHMERSYKR